MRRSTAPPQRAVSSSLSSKKKHQRKRCGKIVFAVTIFLWIVLCWSLYTFSDGPEANASTSRVDNAREGQARKLGPKDVLSGYLHLVDVKIVAGAVSTKVGSTSYGNVKGIFCRLDWSVHKADPSKVPMFKDLLKASPECTRQKKIVMDLKRVADAARKFDRDHPNRFHGRSLNPTGFVLHESRVGSTLVANILAAFDPASNRVYSESSPLILAMKACGLRGESDGNCDFRKSDELIWDVVYLMGRTDDPKERRMFFKIQSIGTTYMHNLVSAFPDVPWMFVYREPVQVMMSHLGGVSEKNIISTNCLRTRHRTPLALKGLVARESGKKWMDISHTEACAAHLAYLCESVLAVRDSSSPKTMEVDVGRVVNYANLVDTLLEDIIPNHFGVLLNNNERERALAITQNYSKGRGGKAGAWKDDTQKKEEAATPKIRSAADAFLRPSYEKLEAIANAAHRRDGESRD